MIDAVSLWLSCSGVHGDGCLWMGWPGDEVRSGRTFVYK